MTTSPCKKGYELFSILKTQAKETRQLRCQDWLKPRQRDFPPEIYSMLERLKKGGKPVYKLADEADGKV